MAAMRWFVMMLRRFPLQKWKLVFHVKGYLPTGVPRSYSAGILNTPDVSVLTIKKHSENCRLFFVVVEKRSGNVRLQFLVY